MMIEQRLLSVLFYAVMALVALTCCIKMFDAFKIAESATVAAWVQAVGSIGAIAGAAVIAGWQQQRSEARARSERAEQARIAEVRIRLWAGGIMSGSVPLDEAMLSTLIISARLNNQVQNANFLLIRPIIDLDLSQMPLENIGVLGEEALLVAQQVALHNRIISNFINSGGVQTATKELVELRSAIFNRAQNITIGQEMLFKGRK